MTRDALTGFTEMIKTHAPIRVQKVWKLATNLICVIGSAFKRRQTQSVGRAVQPRNRAFNLQPTASLTENTRQI